ncbi:hypothetical protein ANO11243_061470 [Dothideomycetidae sp. 11243]|nr:hypothetical protein ANO11243_061470 [fungal sp. No.11243]
MHGRFASLGAALRWRSWSVHAQRLFPEKGVEADFTSTLAFRTSPYQSEIRKVMKQDRESARGGAAHEQQPQQPQQQQEQQRKLKLSSPLTSIPQQVFSAGQWLEHLDLSGTGLSSLPPDFSAQLPHLKILFLSSCHFSVFPSELQSCAQLEMIAFRGNRMQRIPENAFPPRLRWLILTDNDISELPASIGRCERLEKCLLAGNKLRSLPAEMQRCHNLALLRLSANALDAIPEWLFAMPRLSFLSYAGNPCTLTPSATESNNLPSVNWADLEVHSILGQGASGVISAATWHSRSVAVKRFRAAVTSDGAPRDEMAAVVAGGRHENIIDVLGCVADESNKDSAGALVMQLIPEDYRVLGLSPSFESCSRDCFAPETRLLSAAGLAILRGVAGAAAHLAGKGIAHGDLYAHNVLYNDSGHAFLGDFGAATVHGSTDGRHEKLELLAFAHLIQDVMGLMPEADAGLVQRLETLHAECSDADVKLRPRLGEVVARLQTIDAQG